LRTCPTAKDPSENHSEKNDEHHEGEKADCENEKILWPKDLAKEDKFPLNYIKKKQRLFIYLDKW
jgi:hypothetical protein